MSHIYAATKIIRIQELVLDNPIQVPPSQFSGQTIIFAFKALWSITLTQNDMQLCIRVYIFETSYCIIFPALGRNTPSQTPTPTPPHPHSVALLPCYFSFNYDLRYNQNYACTRRHVIQRQNEKIKNIYNPGM